MSSLTFFKITILCIFFGLVGSLGYVYAEESQQLQIEIKYTNGDRIDAYQTNFIIYQDYDKKPFLEKKLETNPETVLLPNHHRYKVEVYVNGMFSEVGYVDLQDRSEKLEIDIPLPGGLKFNVFYDDGQTPVDGATIIIKSQDGTEQRVGKTDDLGQTMRYWLQSTNIKENYYVADVYFDEYLLTSVSNIKIHQGIAQEQRILVPIPSTVQNLITFNLLDTDSHKILKDGGNYSITLTNQKNVSFTESISGNNGEIYFSNIPTGVYSASVMFDNKKDPLWKETKFVISGKPTEFTLKQTNPIEIIPTESDIVELNATQTDSLIESSKEPVSKPVIYQPSVEKFTISCKCVSFRLDDVQDYWLNEVQVGLLNLFSESKVPLTVGIIANSFGEDRKITEEIKNKMENNELVIANHGLDNTPFTLFDKEKQDEMLKESSNKILKTLNVSTKIFIPPQNRFNQDTEKVLIENGYTHLSASLLSDSAPFPLKDQQLYRFPELATTGEYVPSQNRFLGVSSEKTFYNALNALEENGFAVITLHPQEYAVFEGGEYVNEINPHQIYQLKSLLDKIKDQNIQTVRIDEINSKIKIMPTNEKVFSTETTVPNWIKNNAGWWRDGYIDDESFIQGISFLIKNNIIKISETTKSSIQSEIPTWIKDNAGWWAEGRISDDDFIYGMSYLVNHGIIEIDM